MGYRVMLEEEMFVVAQVGEIGRAWQVLLVSRAHGSRVNVRSPMVYRMWCKWIVDQDGLAPLGSGNADMPSGSVRRPDQ